MRPGNLKTRIFLDGGDPGETREMLDLFGFVDGQTTNPSLISKNPEARARMERGEKFSESELLEFYKGVVRELAEMIPQGSVSIEVYADENTTAEHMIEQGREMFRWIPNAHIKLPTTAEGLKAAEMAIKDGIRINMTLCFSQEQAAAVYDATAGARKGDVFVSPFVGRLDDRGEDGMSLIDNILKMYRDGDGHAEVLTASVRSYDHLIYALRLESDIITAPFKAIKEWGNKGFPLPGPDYSYPSSGNLKLLPYEHLDLKKRWTEFNIAHVLTDTGLAKFAADWNNLLQ
jgi:transaldolase